MERLRTYLLITFMGGFTFLCGCSKTGEPTAADETTKDEANQPLAKQDTRCVTPSSGLVSWWPGDGDAADLVSGNHGTLQNGAAFSPGMVGQAFSFDGVDDFVKIPKAPNLDMGEQVTIEFWMKADPSNPMNTCCQGLVTSDFYAVEVSGISFVGITFYVSTDNGASFPNIDQANSGSGAIISSGDWHHIAGTYDGTKLQLYVDGQPWGYPKFHSGLISPMLANSYISIGSEDGRTTCGGCIQTRYFHGLIDEVAVYNRALSADEVGAIFTAGSAGKCKQVTICHKPDTPAQKTMVIPIQALLGHLGHGDTIGPCD